MSDPNDHMISDLSSLKSGVSLGLLFPSTNLLALSYLKPSIKKKSCHILSFEAVSSCIESLNRLKEFLVFLNSDHKTRLSVYYRNVNRDYEKVSLETDSFHEENLSLCLEQFFEVINRIDAGGKTIFDIISNKHQEFNFIL